MAAAYRFVEMEFLEGKRTKWSRPTTSSPLRSFDISPASTGTRSKMSLLGSKFKLADLEKINDNFSADFKLGSSAHGDVYRVVYKGQEIAVKKFCRLPELGETLVRSDTEVLNLTKTKHPNVVQLIHYYCGLRHMHAHNGKVVFGRVVETVLCSKYMECGNLGKHIFDLSCDLDWPTCYKIIRGTCEGLNHLHNSQERPIFHLRLKPSNIFLDENMTAKIGDVGFSTLVPSSETHKTDILNRRDGYMPPEYIDSGHISNKYDMFSLGVIIMKILAGNKGYSRSYELTPKQFADIVINNWKQRLESISDDFLQQMYILQAEACFNIALRCVNGDPRRRPSVKDIVNELEELEPKINKQLTSQSYRGSFAENYRMENIQMDFDSLESILGGSESPRHLKMPFLQFITKNFSDELKIGSGGCGVVYKGILRNQTIAVKKLLNIHTIEDKMFHREVKSMMMVNHKNVVRFLGYCSHTEEQALKMEGNLIMAQARERLLCFEYLINGSLETYLTDELRGLEWQTRYQIIKGICDGLHHLHNENHIIHMDLKPANILLDSTMVPKITDFGLSRLDNISQTMSSKRLVSLGYCAPEYQFHGKMSAKSDIYSLGVIILVLVTGCIEEPDITKVHRRWKHRWNKTAKDAQLGYKQVATCLDLVGRCMQIEPTDRPNIQDITSCLNEMDSSGAKISDRTEECLPLEDMLGVEPLQIHLPYELNKQISCSVELTNDTDDHFAFRILTTSLRPYCISANQGTVPARSRCIVTISLHSLDKAFPAHRQCGMDEFSVRSTRVGGRSLAAMNTGRDIFNEEAGKVIDTVDFKVVLTDASSPSADD